MTTKIISVVGARNAEAERLPALRMLLVAAIAKAVVEAKPIDTAGLLKEVERVGHSVGLRAARDDLAIAWASQAEIIRDLMNTAAEELGAAGVFGYAEADR